MKINSFAFSYPDFTLSIPDISLEKGMIYALVGSNGSGKSTFLKVLSDVIKLKPKPLENGISVAYLPQKPYLFNLSVLKNILLGGDDTEKAAQLMNELDISRLSKHNAQTLSGGESARTALARVLMQSNDLILLDEPTASMDIEATKKAESAIKKYASESCTLIVTHSLAQAERISDYTMFFSGGALIEFGSTKQVLFDPKCEETKRFIAFSK